MRSRKIGIHIGFVLSVVLAGLFLWRAKLAYANPDKLYLSYVLLVMAAGSGTTLVALYKVKPPPPQMKAQ